MNFPEKINLAFLPTPIYQLENLSKKYGKNIFIKRDDLTGVELSGNKIRKLEYSIKQALDQGCDMLITCGGIQSNHARATAYAAAKLGMKSCLLLRGNPDEKIEGNYFLDRLVGADIVIKPADEFNQELMKNLQLHYEAQGYKPYLIPMGASNGIGSFGYIECYQEIIKQEQVLDVTFDGIINAVGSGGTYAGLYTGNQLAQLKKRIIGFNVCDDQAYFIKEINQIIDEVESYLDNKPIHRNQLEIIDGYVGKGYAKNRQEELDCLRELARMEGVVLDPVYTGKAFYGLICELEKGNFANLENILFIHTGGLYGLFPKQAEFIFS